MSQLLLLLLQPWGPWWGGPRAPSTSRDEAFTEPGTEGLDSLQEDEEEREEEGKIFGKEEGEEGEAQAALALPCPFRGPSEAQVTKLRGLRTPPHPPPRAQHRQLWREGGASLHTF